MHWQNSNDYDIVQYRGMVMDSLNRKWIIVVQYIYMYIYTYIIYIIYIYYIYIYICIGPMEDNLVRMTMLHRVLIDYLPIFGWDQPRDPSETFYSSVILVWWRKQLGQARVSMSRADEKIDGSKCQSHPRDSTA